MKINIDNCVKHNGKCETCRHLNICKYSAEFRKAIESTSELQTEFSSPININISCDKYEKVCERQDGFYFR